MTKLFDLSGKRAVVTGGGRGLGRGMAEGLAEAGAKVVILGSSGAVMKAAEEMRNSLKVGDEITTIGGIVGTICAVKEKTIVLETGADRVRIEFTKWAISSKGTQSTEEAPAPEKSDKDKKDKKEKKEDK